MSPADPIASLRRRLMVVLGVDAVCLLIGAVAVYLYLSQHVAWAGAVFAIAMITGFAVQIWLVVSFARARPPG